MADVFLDTSYAIALAVESDQHHQRAMDLANQLLVQAARILTTRAVLFEIGNALARQKYRNAAITMLQAIHDDSTVDIVEIDRAIYERGFELYSSRRDKEWGLIDCTSFVVMQDKGLTEALTADEHFRQAGFRALLKES